MINKEIDSLCEELKKKIGKRIMSLQKEAYEKGWVLGHKLSTDKPIDCYLTKRDFDEWWELKQLKFKQRYEMVPHVGRHIKGRENRLLIC